MQRPRVLVLAERHDSLHHAARLLKSSGYTVQTIFEDSHALASILDREDVHFVLLTVHPTTRPLSVPQLIERLRQLRYEQPITCCMQGKVSVKTRTAYKDLSVNRVLALPANACGNVLNALAWLGGQVAFREGGLTILEV